MSTAKTDRRSARTKGALETSLLALIRTKGYEATTIRDICAAANVGRSTFYAHYRSKDDLKRSGLEHLRVSLLRTQARTSPTSNPDRFGFSLGMLEHARAHLDVYRAMKRDRGGSIALARIREVVSELIRREVEVSCHDTPDMIPDLVVQYLVGAYMAVLIWWLDGGARLAPEKVDAMFRRLATGAVGEAGTPESSFAKVDTRWLEGKTFKLHRRTVSERRV